MEKVEVLAMGALNGGLDGLRIFWAAVADLKAEGVREAVVHDEACTHWWKLRVRRQPVYLYRHVQQLRVLEGKAGPSVPCRRLHNRRAHNRVKLRTRLVVNN